MKVVVLSGTPKSEGLSASCVSAAAAGAKKAGASVVVIDLQDVDRTLQGLRGWVGHLQE